MAASLADLKPDPANARAHNPRNIGMIADALQQVGAARSIVVDEDNVILAGNGVVAAATQVGIERVRIVETDGTEIIAVKRTGLTPGQKKKLALYDNRTGELATWDAAQIAAELEGGFDLSSMFASEELSAILAAAADRVIGDTAIDRDAQGVASTWDQVKTAAADRVVIGDIEARLPQFVIDRVVSMLNSRYEETGTPVHKTLESLLLAGVDSLEHNGN